MEHILRKVKNLFKATQPNNIQGAVVKKSRALARMSQILEHFDYASGAIVRSSKHKTKSAHDEELKLTKELKTVDPFTAKTGRTFDKFASITAPTKFSVNKTIMLGLTIIK